MSLALVHSVPRREPSIPPPPPSSRRALPMLVLGEGERRDDCDEYAGCLSRFVTQSRRRFPHGDPAASCPAGCSSFTSSRELELLHTAASRPGSFT